MTYAETKIELLQEECGYDPDRDTGVDSLIDYKDALEGEYAALLMAADPIAQHQRSGYECGTLTEAIKELRRVLNGGIPVGPGFHS